jgi:hypothetical protein
MGIRDKPTAPRSPWQNPYVERLIGTIRRECLDHMIVFGEAHLRRIRYAAYYNECAFIARWTRMPHSIGRLSASALSHHSLSSAAFITNIAHSSRATHPARSHRYAAVSVLDAKMRMQFWAVCLLAFELLLPPTRFSARLVSTSWLVIFVHLVRGSGIVVFISNHRTDLPAMVVLALKSSLITIMAPLRPAPRRQTLHSRTFAR